MSMPCAELEITLHAESLLSRRTGIYTAELRFAEPDSDVVHPPVLTPVPFDLAQLLALEHAPLEYGRLLGAELLDPAELRELFTYARDAAALADRDLRVRLFIGPSAPELHRIRREALADPDSG